MPLAWGAQNLSTWIEILSARLVVLDPLCSRTLSQIVSPRLDLLPAQRGLGAIPSEGSFLDRILGRAFGERAGQFLSCTSPPCLGGGSRERACSPDLGSGAWGQGSELMGRACVLTGEDPYYSSPPTSFPLLFLFSLFPSNLLSLSSSLP